ncbi:MAG: 30S ribosomal protein S1 [Nitrospirae bacterium]|nr:MAG: 30S ribosomal protein S1 [Nitrospirae bacterium 13_2_20CM_2_62_8]OLC43096.1 MAG: 30S ribosomal protein S1 [Nitrospirae bacterium 13_1_40CM_4_62_6]OLC81195.1 MAG: 30S ribosomal protein S1 [Nitrospirae bacterium 13_1_40CM_3_62_11]OLD37888.1 MAG: 30S ribosomal protein S1 [Nitrospirae bacterium 13_1_40CM_2_62_10]OLE41963.1 MAG: 30S ribosomal protein S1 [Nitrospirae bacterium 13_1_20CM_2_62_14]TLY39668.1 MAG: 30S ribosomal protein S1 [Nitrospirota bacterium]
MNMASKQTDEQLDRGALAALYEETFRNFEEGSIIEGGVVAISKDKVVVDIGYKSEGIIPADQFSGEELQALKISDRLQVYIEEREDADGNLILSKEKADKMKVWEDLEKSYKDEKVVEGRILSRIKGGMMVDIGVKAFLPGSQIDLHPVRDLDGLVGKSFPLKIIKINHRRGNVVVSRRVLLEESRDRKRQTTLSSLKEGQLSQGTVKNITDYGAFIDLGGIDGLLHITDMSWGRVGHPSEMFVIGDKVEVMVLKYDRESGRISLGVKQKSSDPWTSVATKYPVGSRVRGRVVSLTDYGAFIELEPGVEGLVHVSEMSWTHEVRHPSRLVSVGDQIEAAVLNVDANSRKISLGMKQTAPNPWDMVETKYPSGTRIEGKVKSLTDFGAFIGLEEGIDGLIHISDMSWARHIKHPSELFKKGQKIEAVVLRIDKDKERLSLGYKQLTRDPWEEEIPQRYKVGTTAPGKVTKITDFGVFVELEGGVEGLIHISETGLEPQARLEDKFKINDTVSAKIIKTDREERKIALSLREQQLDAERKQVDEFHATQGAVDQSLGRTAQKTKKRPDAESGDPDVTS